MDAVLLCISLRIFFNQIMEVATNWLNLIFPTDFCQRLQHFWHGMLYINWINLKLWQFIRGFLFWTRAHTYTDRGVACHRAHKSCQHWTPIHNTGTCRRHTERLWRHNDYNRSVSRHVWRYLENFISCFCICMSQKHVHFNFFQEVLDRRLINGKI